MPLNPDPSDHDRRSSEPPFQVDPMTDLSRRLQAPVPQAFVRVLLTILALGAFLVAAFAATAQAQDYNVRAGDVLGIEVLEDSSLNREVLVLPDGRFNFPFAGSVQASGRSTGQIAQEITAGIADNFASQPNVFVSVRTLRQEAPRTGPSAPAVMNIYLLGEVNAPGIKQVVPGATLLQALSESGGFTNFAALRRVQLRRTDPRTNVQTVTLINYKALANGAALSRDIILGEGDVILVPQRRLFE